MSSRLGAGARAVLGALVALTTAAAVAAAADSQEIQRFVSELGGPADVKVNPATGAARFVRIAPGAETAALRGPATSLRQRSDDFLARHAGIFGIRDAGAELALSASDTDAQGGQHLTYSQRYRGVPVFAARLKTHFDAQGRLRAVNGVSVPDIDLDVTPRRGAAEAGRTALVLVTAQGRGQDLSVRGAELVVYRAGLLQGVRGPNHLAWRVEVGNGGNVREFVFVDAHTGKVVDQLTGVTDALDRRAYNTTANFPASPFWVEGDPFPTADDEANNVIEGSGESYDFYSLGFGRDSFDGAGGTMHGVFRRTESCPNASWNSVFTSYCPGVTPDDVVTHEWTHAYTEFTHGLIYAWQSGALNEAYSDIFGEVVDFINGRGTDTPGGPRTAEACTVFSPPQAQLAVNSPAAIAGNYVAQSAQFGPPLTPAGVTGDVVLALDDANPTGPSTTDACTALTNAAAVAGKIALADRGSCTFVVKVTNAQAAGAIGVIIANNVPTGLPGMGGSAPAIVIPSLGVTQAAGNAIKAELGGVVNATLRSTAGAGDDSYRWLVGEDATGFGGAIRDIWNPNCYGDPGKVSDTAYYHCGPITSDNGGVHVNSGIPNHGFALLVDGGTYNGHTVGALGLVKTSHIYFRAMDVYQNPASDFADHADSLEQSCEDLIGVDLIDPATGAPSGQAISAADCAQVSEAMAAVEMRTPPTQCNFQPILAQDPPDRCEAGAAQANVFFDDFESNPIGAWTVSHETPSATFTPRDWEWATTLPEREGAALFGPDPDIGDCSPAADESGVLHADSPVITLPPGAANPRLTFDHWVATEAGWDGGNLKISVNGGPWQQVAAADFAYNPYNATLNTIAQGNTNPLAGEPGFTGADGGSVDGSWGRSHVNLAAYAVPGDTVRLRLDFGSDGCTGITGWYVDDPTLYACVSPDPPDITIDDVSVTEGNSGFTNADFTVSLSHASASPVKFWYVTLPGSAWPLFDFVPDIGRVTIDPLQLSGRIRVKVRGDRRRERDETFFVLLFAPSGGAILDGVGKGTIINDDGH